MKTVETFVNCWDPFKSSGRVSLCLVLLPQGDLRRLCDVLNPFNPLLKLDVHAEDPDHLVLLIHDRGRYGDAQRSRHLGDIEIDYARGRGYLQVDPSRFIMELAPYSARAKDRPYDQWVIDDL